MRLAKYLFSTGPPIPSLVKRNMPKFDMSSSSCFSSTLSLSTSPLVLLDFDANFLHKDLVNDIGTLMDNAAAQGITKFVVPGSTLEDSRGALELAATKNNVSCNRSGDTSSCTNREDWTIYATAGVHPYHTESVNINDEISVSTLHELLLSSPYCVAVGETGLDFSDGFPAKEYQLPWFELQVQLALKHNLPLYLHVRQAREEFVAVLQIQGVLSPRCVGAAATTSSTTTDDDSDPVVFAPVVPCCVHCFTGSAEELREYVSYGFYIGLTGYIINSLSMDQLVEWLGIIPSNRLVIETDAPYMGFKGCRKTESRQKKSKYPNVPSALTLVATVVAEALTILHRNREGDNKVCVSAADVAALTTHNALRFLGSEIVK